MKNILLEEYLKDIQTEASVSGNVAGIYAFGIIPWALWRTIGSIFDKSKRECGTYSISNKRDSCIHKARIRRSEKRIDALRKFKTEECKDKNKVDKCKNAADVRIKYEKEQIEKNENKLAKLKKQDRV